jgi:hypothetical protein
VPHAAPQHGLEDGAVYTCDGGGKSNLEADQRSGPLAHLHPQGALIERHAAGRKVVVIIDEAHAMPRESLEQIRLLSNLETRTHKLLQIALSRPMARLPTR